MIRGEVVSNREILKKLLLLFLGWRLALILVTFLGLSVFPNADVPAHKYFLPSPDLDYWTRWANWDGGHYLGIAVNGYLPMQTVFFPLYPLIIKIFTLIHVPAFWAGFLISQVSALVTLFFLYKLCLLDFPSKVAGKAVLALLIFPTSFYLVSLYNESLFLALTLSAIYFARKRRWLLSFALAGLAASTRLIGLATIAAVLAEYLIRGNPEFKFRSLWETASRRVMLLSLLIYLILNYLEKFFISHRFWLAGGLVNFSREISFYALLATSFIAFVRWIRQHINPKRLLNIQTLNIYLVFLPLVFYLIFQKIFFGSYFSFLLNESLWQKSLSFPWQSLFYYLNLIKAHSLFHIGDNVRLIFTLFIFILLVWGFIICLYRLRTSYKIFYFLALLIPLLSGTLLDFSRYALVIFPLFIVLARMRGTLILSGGLLSVMILAILSVLYINSYWFM